MNETCVKELESERKMANQNESEREKGKAHEIVW
jgi:hypothetical protein